MTSTKTIYKFQVQYTITEWIAKSTPFRKKLLYHNIRSVKEDYI